MAEHMIRYLGGLEPYSHSWPKKRPPLQWSDFQTIEQQQRDFIYNDDTDKCDCDQLLMGGSVKAGTAKFVEDNVVGPAAHTRSLFRGSSVSPPVCIIDGTQWIVCSMMQLKKEILDKKSEYTKWTFFYDSFCDMLQRIYMRHGGSTVVVCFDQSELVDRGKTVTQRKRKQAIKYDMDADDDELMFDGIRPTNWLLYATKRERNAALNELEQVLIPSSDPESLEYGELLQRLNKLRDSPTADELVGSNNAVTAEDLACIWTQKNVMKRAIVHNLVKWLRCRSATYKAGGQFVMPEGHQVIIMGHDMDRWDLDLLFVESKIPDCYKHNDPAIEALLYRNIPLCFSRKVQEDTLHQLYYRSPIGDDSELRLPGGRMKHFFPRLDGVGLVSMINDAKYERVGEGHIYKLHMFPLPGLFCLLGEADPQMIYAAHRLFRWGLGPDIELFTTDRDTIWLAGMMLYQKYMRRGRTYMPQLFHNRSNPGVNIPPDVCYLNQYFLALDRFIAELPIAPKPRAPLTAAEKQRNAEFADMVKAAIAQDSTLTVAEARGQVAQYLENNPIMLFAQPIAASTSTSRQISPMASTVEMDRHYEDKDRQWHQVDAGCSSRSSPPPPPPPSSSFEKSSGPEVPEWIQYLCYMMLCGNDIGPKWPRLGFVKFHETFLALYQHRGTAHLGSDGPWRIVKPHPLTPEFLMYDVTKVMWVITCACAMSLTEKFPRNNIQSNNWDLAQYMAWCSTEKLIEHVEAGALKGLIHNEAMHLKRRLQRWVLDPNQKPELSQWPGRERPTSVPELRAAMLKCVLPVATIGGMIKAHAGYLFSVSQVGSRIIRFVPSEAAGYRRDDETGALYYDLGHPHNIA